MTVFSFAPYEIFEIIAKTEATVARFYAHLANLGLGAEAVKVFQTLSEEETGHGDIFLEMARIQKNIHSEKKESTVNLREILEGAITRIDRSLLSLTPLDRKSVDLRRAVEIAIRHEQESIQVYTELLRVMPRDFSDVFKKTINVEQGHLRVLEDVLQRSASV